MPLLPIMLRVAPLPIMLRVTPLPIMLRVTPLPVRSNAAFLDRVLAAECSCMNHCCVLAVGDSHTRTLSVFGSLRCQLGDFVRAAMTHLYSGISHNTIARAWSLVLRFTANTMASCIEAMGMAVPGSSSNLATDGGRPGRLSAEKIDDCKRTVYRGHDTPGWTDVPGVG